MDEDGPYAVERTANRRTRFAAAFERWADRRGRYVSVRTTCFTCSPIFPPLTLDQVQALRRIGAFGAADRETQ